MYRGSVKYPSKGWLAAIAVAVGYLPNLVQLFYPFQGDHYIHGWVGWRLACGEWPYVDHAMHNFPGGAMLYAVVALLFGPGGFWYRVVDWCWQLGTGLLMFSLAGRLAGPWAAFAAMVAYGLQYGRLDPGTAGNRDPMLTLLYLVSLLLVARASDPAGSRWSRGRRPAASALAAGLVCSMLVLIKPTHGLWWLALGGWLIRRVRRKPGRARLLLLYGLGCLAPIVLIVAGYAWVGHLRELWECTVHYNLIYGSMPRPFITLRPSDWAALILCAWGLVRTIGDRGRRATALPTLLWLGCVTAGALAQRKYLSYQLFPMQAAVTFWAVVAAVMLLADLRPALGRLPVNDGGRVVAALRGLPPRFSTAATLLLLVLAAVGLRASCEPFVRACSAGLAHLGGTLSKDALDARLLGPSFDEARRVAEYVAAHSRPDEGLVAFAFAPQIGYLSRRKSPSRFFAPRMIFPYRDGDPDPLWRRWQAEFTRAVLEHPPRFIIFDRSHMVGDWYRPTKARRMVAQRLPRIERLLQRRYRRIRLTRSYQVYRRTDSPSRPVR